MSNMNPKDAQDAAFDARCRAALEGRAVDAPAPAESLFAAAEPTGNKAARLAVMALAFAGVAAWGVYRSDVPAPAIEEGSVTEVEAPQEVTDASPIDASPTDAVSVQADATVPEAVGLPETPEVEAATSEVVPVAAESSAPAAMPVVEPEVAPTEVVHVSAAPVSEPEASLETTDRVSPQDVPAESTDIEEPVSNDPVPAPSEAPENTPTLTLPLTLPSGGGL